MPIDLTPPYRSRAGRRPKLAIAAQLIAIVIIASASIALMSAADGSRAGSAEQEIAGP